MAAASSQRSGEIQRTAGQMAQSNSKLGAPKKNLIFAPSNFKSII